MPRKKIEKTKPSLHTLIPQYAENKRMQDDYKKLCDEEGKQIKEMMTSNNLDEAESEGYVAKCIIQHRESINEEKLLDVLLNHKEIAESNGIIKTKYYIDMDNLESAIYKGELNKDILMEIDKCRDTKEVVTLRISKVKEKKNAN